MVALSLSNVITESSGFTWSPVLTNTSMISTSVKSPMSGISINSGSDENEFTLEDSPESV